MRRIDSHQHFWDRSLPFNYGWLDLPVHQKISRTYLPEHLAPLIAECGIDATIFVQTQHYVAENRWVLSLADQNPFIAGVVGWVDLQSERIEEQLDEFVSHPKFVGIRHVTQDEPDDDFIIRPAVLRGLEVLQRRDVAFDMLFFVKHLKHAVTLGQRFPELRLVLDHISKPRIRERVTEDWLPHLKAAASCPNIYCKLSGMVTEADWERWKPSDLQPYVDAALEAFGVERCMFGSDWPVCELAGSYRQVHSALFECVSRLSQHEQARIFGGTAESFYRLPK